jgi:lipopolysaccharide biosynthesis protein
VTKSICFHLPQFHPIPENDEWWGRGFTEWRNTVRARPRFKGHYQPHLPADLGYYDLRLAETRAQQAELASRYGVSGFCYYHYWFNGRRLLEAPVEGILASGEPDFPFMLCWANENWTRRWDGADREVLISQSYGPQDDLNHIRHLAEVFEDPRYIRKDGKPCFLVYKASELPDPRRTLDTWRHEYARLGLGELFLCRVEAHGKDRGDPRALGFDAAVEFQPDWENQPALINPNILVRIPRRLFRPNSGYRRNGVYTYDGMVEQALGKPEVDYPRFRCVAPSWDNSARRAKDATIYKDATPEKFEYWLSETLRRTERESDQEFIFVNAWNEWAEGAHLEPDERWGHAFLEAHLRGMSTQGQRQLNLAAYDLKDASWS